MSSPEHRWTLAAAILGSSMAFADGTVVNVALPAIQADLGADASQAQWVIESYALFLASLLLAGGAPGDRFGRRRVRIGPRIPLVAGPLIAAAGFALFTRPSIGGSYWSTFFPATCVLGLGMTLTIAPLTTTVMGSIGTELAGAASGVNNAVSRTAGLLAIAALGLLMSGRFAPELERRLSALQVPAAVKTAVQQQEQRLGAIELPRGLDDKPAAAVRQAVGEAFVAGFRAVMWASTALALLSALAAWLWIDGKPARWLAEGKATGSAAQDRR